jgi:hypothetical protein
MHRVPLSKKKSSSSLLKIQIYDKNKLIQGLFYCGDNIPIVCIKFGSKKFRYFYYILLSFTDFHIYVNNSGGHYEVEYEHLIWIKHLSICGPISAFQPCV